jgi:hypothetical protein
VRFEGVRLTCKGREHQQLPDCVPGYVHCQRSPNMPATADTQPPLQVGSSCSLPLTSSPPGVASSAAASGACPHASVVEVVGASTLTKEVLQTPLAAAALAVKHAHAAARPAAAATASAAAAAKGSKAVAALAKQAREDVGCAGRVHATVPATSWAPCKVEEGPSTTSAWHAVCCCCCTRWGWPALEALLPVHVIDLQCRQQRGGTFRCSTAQSQAGVRKVCTCQGRQKATYVCV